MYFCVSRCPLWGRMEWNEFGERKADWGRLEGEKYYKRENGMEEKGRIKR